ncbi:MAG: carboxymuconolactone decarboxylase family protein [Parafilimonas sp.]
MKKRIDFNDVQPTAYDAMDALDKYVNESSIDKLHRGFIRIRASQINGCAYCVDMHSRDARQVGESEQRIF